MKSTRITTSGEKNRGTSVDRQPVGESFQHLPATALTFASVANGVALALGVSQTLQGNGVQYYYVLNFCSFVLMVRLWWRYAGVSYYVPSSSLDQYCVDFAIAAIGIAAVFFFSRPDRWALCYAAVFPFAALKAAQLADTLNPVVYRRQEDYRVDLNRIHRKIPIFLVTAAAFWVFWLFCYVTGNNKKWVLLCSGVLLVIFFIDIRMKVRRDHLVSKRGISSGPTATSQDRAHAEPRRAKKKSQVKNKEMKQKKSVVKKKVREQRRGRWF